MTMDARQYWIDQEPKDGESFSVLHYDPRTKGIQNSLGWGYKWMPIPESAVVVFGARAIWHKGGPDFPNDRLEWLGREEKGPSNVTNIDKENTGLVKWMVEKMRVINWSGVNSYYRAFFLEKELEGEAYRMAIYAGKTQYVFLTAWKEV